MATSTVAIYCNTTCTPAYGDGNVLTLDRWPICECVLMCAARRKNVVHFLKSYSENIFFYMYHCLYSRETSEQANAAGIGNKWGCKT